MKLAKCNYLKATGVASQPTFSLGLPVPIMRVSCHYLIGDVANVIKKRFISCDVYPEAR